MLNIHITLTTVMLVTTVINLEIVLHNTTTYLRGWFCFEFVWDGPHVLTPQVQVS